MTRPPLRAVGRQPASRRTESTAGTGAQEFDALYEREWFGLVALGWSLTGNWSVAEELAQDAFADAFRRWSEIEALDRPGAWLRRAVVNRAASHRRHRGMEHRVLARVDARSKTETDGPAADRTGERAADRVDDPAFWAAVRSLPPNQAAALSLHYLEDRSVSDISEILGCRPATVKVHLHRGRAALSKRLASVTGDRPHPGRPTSAPPHRTNDDLAEETR